jgi:hypothetical protein
MAKLSSLAAASNARNRTKLGTRRKIDNLFHMNSIQVWVKFYSLSMTYSVWIMIFEKVIGLGDYLARPPVLDQGGKK